LSVETTGPRRIVVGKEGTYQVTVRNQGGVAAEQVVVSVDLPEWTELAGAEATSGATGVSQKADRPAQFRWTLGRLEAHSHQSLTLRVVPRQARPFELSARCDYQPPASQAVIEVQEAKLALALHGPREVTFGKAETYKLDVSNVGTADAENVVLILSPHASGEKIDAASRRLGTLAAGQKRTITMELTARQDGNLVIQIEARADGGLRAELNEQIAVRRAKLRVEVEGPSVVYAGNEASYRVHVRNEGNAAAERVAIQATIPSGAKYTSASHDGRLTPDQAKVLWTIDRLSPGSDTMFQLACQMAAGGAQRFDVECVAEGESAVSTSTVTQVETAPKLLLTVEEPPGPVALEQEATYQLTVQNRGTAPAEEVEVVIYFAEHVEPVTAEGSGHRLSPGQVVFEVMPSLAPGQSASYTVKAKADQVGNHVYRVEVHAKATGIRLVREGMTRFYAATASRRPAEGSWPGGRAGAGQNTSAQPRTADRRDRTVLPTAPTLPPAPAERP